MNETIQFFTLQLSLLAVVLLLHTYIGLHVIRRTLIFSDLALAQLAAFGALVGISMGVQYGTPVSYLVSLLMVLAGAFLLAMANPKNSQIPREAAIGIMYAMALVASLLMGDKISGGSAYVTKTLEGSMLWVTWPLVGITTVVYAALILFHYRFRNEFIALAEKKMNKTKEKQWDFLFFATQGIITVLIVPIAGVLLAYTFLMIPAAIAAMFTRSWGKGVAAGWLIGLFSCFSGLAVSYRYNFPYGPTLVISLGVIFLCAVFSRMIVLRKRGSAL
jgi:zinc/manganese transport system permease protein